MAESTKESQRAALHKAIWQIANDVRGAVDGWDFKAYVLGFLYYRFISEELTRYIDEGEHEAADVSFSYAAMDDEEAEGARESVVDEKGFFILPSQLFENVAARCDRDPNLNETLAAVFAAVEGSSVGTASEKDFRGLFCRWKLKPRSHGSWKRRTLISERSVLI